MIPTYEEIMLPLLKYLSDGEEHNLSQTHDDLATQLKLTDEELRELLPSGKKTIFRNRISWARTYMVKAGLIISTRRSHFQKRLPANPPRVAYSHFASVGSRLPAQSA